MAKLRSYRCERSARIFAAVLAQQFPHRRFEVRQSPLTAYAFRWLIIETTSGAWVAAGR